MDRHRRARLIVPATGLLALAAGSLLVSAGPVAASPADLPPIISTVAGGTGGPGPASQIPAGGCAVTFAGRFIYTSGDDTIRRISQRSGQLTTLAGNGVLGFSPDGTPGRRTALGPSCGLAVDSSGNLLFADGEVIGPQGGHRGGNNLIRVLAANSGTFYGQPMIKGDVYTIAGNGSYGFAGDGGPATDAELADPAGLAVDQSGNVIVADGENNRIRVIAERTGISYGQQMTAGDIYTVAGGGTTGLGDAGPGTKAELNFSPHTDHSHIVNTPGAIVRVDHHGNIVVADTNDERIRVIAGTTGRFYGQAMRAGYIYTVAGGGKGLLGNGRPATKALLRTPTGIAIDHSGDIIIADRNDEAIRVVAVRSGRYYRQPMTAGDIYSLAEDILSPEGVSVDGAGNIVISGTCVRGTVVSNQLLSWPCLRVLAETPGRSYGMTMTRGRIYPVSGILGDHYGDGGPALHAQFDTGLFMFASIGGAAVGLAADAAGDVAIADNGNSRVRLASRQTGTFFGQSMQAGDIYTIAGDGHVGLSGNGGPGPQARIGFVTGLAFGAAGNVVIADGHDKTVRVIAARSGTFYGQAMTAGDIYTIAGGSGTTSAGIGGPASQARLGEPTGLAIDQHGNIVFGDEHAIKIIAEASGTFYGQAMTAGDIYEITSVQSYDGLAIDADGNIVATGVISRQIYGPQWFIDVIAGSSGTYYGQPMTAGQAYEIAGGGTSTASGVSATSAVITPTGLALDAAGNVVIGNAEGFIADEQSDIVRVVAVSTGTFYGIAMTAGDIYTIAGGAKSGLGDGGPPLEADLGQVTAVAPGPGGSILVAVNDRVRAISG